MEQTFKKENVIITVTCICYFEQCKYILKEITKMGMKRNRKQIKKLKVVDKKYYGSNLSKLRIYVQYVQLRTNTLK